MERRTQKREGTQRRPFVESVKNIFSRGKTKRDATMAEKVEFAEEQHDEIVENNISDVNHYIMAGLLKDIDAEELL